MIVLRNRGFRAYDELTLSAATSRDRTSGEKWGFVGCRDILLGGWFV